MGAGRSPVQVAGNPVPTKSPLCWPLSSLCLRKWCLGLWGKMCVCERERDRDTYTHTLLSCRVCGSKFYKWKNIYRCDFLHQEIK